MKKFIDALKSCFLSPENLPAARWSNSRLEEVRCHLESKDVGQWTREEHYLAVEFVIQRYLPADSNRTQAEYDVAFQGMKDKIDRNIDYPDAPREEVKVDLEFDAWLKETLSSK